MKKGKALVSDRKRKAVRAPKHIPKDSFFFATRPGPPVAFPHKRDVTNTCTAYSKRREKNVMSLPEAWVLRALAQGKKKPQKKTLK